MCLYLLFGQAIQFSVSDQTSAVYGYGMDFVLVNLECAFSCGYETCNYIVLHCSPFIIFFSLSRSHRVSVVKSL